MSNSQEQEELDEGVQDQQVYLRIWLQSEYTEATGSPVWCTAVTTH